MQILVALVLACLPFAARAQCPLACICFPLTSTVDCTPRPEMTGVPDPLTAVPSDVPSSTITLIMTGNVLTELLPGAFDAYPNLENLILDNNLFITVPDLDVPQLISLRLDGNNLQIVQDDAFSNLTSLETLLIRQTPLMTLNATSFRGLTSLQNLYVDDNQLTELPSDLLSFIPQLQLLSVTGNALETIPNGLFNPLNATVAQVDLTDNPWSCDCFLGWLGEYLSINNILVNNDQTVCLWPESVLNQPISDVMVFSCYEPIIIQSPQNMVILSNETLVLQCRIDGAPFVDVSWTQNGQPVEFTERVFLSQFSASLEFVTLELNDSGIYQCFVENINGSAMSGFAELTILESTCFDLMLSSHETDVDCGGEFCTTCNITQGCQADRDCIEDLICLYPHQLPSGLHYISPTDDIAFTCADPEVAPMLLESILQSELPADIFGANVSGLAAITDLVATLHDLLATQLEVTRSTISNVQVSSVEKDQRPLIQVWFNLQRSRNGEEAITRVLQQVDSGALKATVRIRDETNAYRVRLNL